MKIKLELGSSLGLLGDMQELSDAQIIQQLRAKAQRYSDIADQMEGKDLKKQTLAPLVAPKPSVTDFSLVSGQATAEGIRQYLSKKGARAGDLAKQFNCSESSILAIISDPASGIEHAGRGWLKLSEKSDQDFPGASYPARE